MQTIAGTALTTSYVTYVLSMQDIQLTAGTSYFLEISRSTGQSGSNYYQFDSSATTLAGYYYSTNNTSTRTDSTGNMFFSIQYAYNYTTGRVRGSDTRYETTNKSIGKILDSGAAGDTVLVALE